MHASAIEVVISASLHILDSSHNNNNKPIVIGQLGPITRGRHQIVGPDLWLLFFTVVWAFFRQFQGFTLPVVPPCVAPCPMAPLKVLNMLQIYMQFQANERGPVRYG